MHKVTQLSFLDHPELIGTARYGASVSPLEMASRFHTLPERSFDDLGFYDFFGVDSDLGLFGFRMHTRPDACVSYVTFIAKGQEIDAIDAISHFCDLPREKIYEFKENW